MNAPAWSDIDSAHAQLVIYVERQAATDSWPADKRDSVLAQLQAAHDDEEGLVSLWQAGMRPAAERYLEAARNLFAELGEYGLSDVASSALGTSAVERGAAWESSQAGALSGAVVGASMDLRQAGQAAGQAAGDLAAASKSFLSTKGGKLAVAGAVAALAWFILRR